MKHHFFTKLVAVALTASSLSTSVYGANGTGYPDQPGTSGVDPLEIGPGYPTQRGTRGVDPVAHIAAFFEGEISEVLQKIAVVRANPGHAATPAIMLQCTASENYLRTVLLPYIKNDLDRAGGTAAFNRSMKATEAILALETAKVAPYL